MEINFDGSVDANAYMGTCNTIKPFADVVVQLVAHNILYVNYLSFWNQWWLVNNYNGGHTLFKISGGLQTI